MNAHKINGDFLKTLSANLSKSFEKVSYSEKSGELGIQTAEGILVISRNEEATDILPVKIRAFVPPVNGQRNVEGENNLLSGTMAQLATEISKKTFEEFNGKKVFNEINVVNKRTHKPSLNAIDIYIGRGSDLGNEFTHIPSGTKAKFVVSTVDEAIQKNLEQLGERILSGDTKTLKALENIYLIAKTNNVNLVCYCAPGKCHGDSIKDLLNEAFMENGKMIFPSIEKLRTNEVTEKLETIGSKEEVTVRNRAEELRKANKIKINLRDTAVIRDHTSKYGYRSLPGKEVSNKIVPAFVGTIHECKAWVEAETPEIRKEIEEQSLKRWNEKINVGNHALDIAKPGQQADMFGGKSYTLPVSKEENIENGLTM